MHLSDVQVGPRQSQDSQCFFQWLFATTAVALEHFKLVFEVLKLGNGGGGDTERVCGT